MSMAIDIPWFERQRLIRDEAVSPTPLDEVQRRMNRYFTDTLRGVTPVNIVPLEVLLKVDPDVPESIIGCAYPWSYPRDAFVNGQAPDLNNRWKMQGVVIHESAEILSGNWDVYTVVQDVAGSEVSGQIGQEAHRGSYVFAAQFIAELPGFIREAGDPDVNRLWWWFGLQPEEPDYFPQIKREMMTRLLAIAKDQGVITKKEAQTGGNAINMVDPSRTSRIRRRLLLLR